MKQTKIIKSGSFIDVYVNGKLVLEITDMEFGIEVYDTISHTFLPVISSWLNGAFEEIQPYLDNLMNEHDF